MNQKKLKMFPIIPFITEKLWISLFNKDNFLMNEVVVNIDVQDNYITSQNNFKNLIQIISSIRNLRSEINIPYKDLIVLNINNNDNNFCSFLNSSKNEICKILKLNELTLNDSSIKLIALESDLSEMLIFATIGIIKSPVTEIIYSK